VCPEPAAKCRTTNGFGSVLIRLETRQLSDKRPSDAKLERDSAGQAREAAVEAPTELHRTVLMLARDLPFMVEIRGDSRVSAAPAQAEMDPREKAVADF